VTRFEPMTSAHFDQPYTKSLYITDRTKRNAQVPSDRGFKRV